MSVINKMLQDLDQQQKDRIVQPHLTRMATVAPSVKHRPWMIALLLLSITLFVGSAVVLWQKLTPSLPQPAATSADVKPSIETAVEPVIMEPPGSELEPEPEPRNQVEPVSEAVTTPVAATEVAATQPSADVEAKPSTTAIKKPSQALLQPKPEQVASALEPNLSVVTPNTADVPAKREPDLQPNREPEISVKPEPVMTVTPVPLTPQEQAQQLMAEAQVQPDSQLSVELLQRALALTPDYHQARLQLIDTLSGLDPQLALMEAAQGFSQFPAQGQYALMAAELSQMLGQPEQAKLWLAKTASLPLTLEHRVRRAALAQQLQQFELASTDYRVLTEQQPTQSRWWLGLAYNLDQLGQYPAAIEHYRRAIELGSLSGAAREFVLARLQQLRGS